MSKKTFLIGALFVLSLTACNSNKTGKTTGTDSDSLKKASLANSVKAAKVLTPDSAKSDEQSSVDTSKSGRLVGIWALVDTDNATFAITKNKFVYPENNESFGYKRVGDTIMIDYKDRVDTFGMKFKGADTLMLTSRKYGDNVYYRFVD